MEGLEYLRGDNKAAWYKISGFITFYPYDADKKNLYYLACLICKKKVTDEHHGYHCMNCGKT